MQPSKSCTLRVSNSIADTKRDFVYGRTLFIDASGVLSNFGSAPTGIPRVQRFLVEAALADPDKSIKVVRFDRRRRAFRDLSALERRQVCSDDLMYFDTIRHLARQVAGNRGLTLYTSQLICFFAHIAFVEGCSCIYGLGELGI